MKTKQEVEQKIKSLKDDITSLEKEAGNNHRFRVFIREDINSLDLKLDALKWVLK